MHKLLAAWAGALLSTVAVGADIDPATTSFPWMNGADREARYRMADHANTVHVFEAWRIDCSWCNRNAEQVVALAAEYAGDARVQFVDLGLDANNSAYSQWISRHTPNYPVVKDVGRIVWEALRREDGVPQTFVVDCAGNLVDYTLGYWADAEKASLRAAIAQAKETTCE